MTPNERALLVAIAKVVMDHIDNSTYNASRLERAIENLENERLTLDDPWEDR